MKIGLLSDTHGDVARTVRAAGIMKDRGVQAVVHCGDICAQGVVTALAQAFDPPRTPVFAVLGNCDYGEYVGLGVELCDRFADINLDGRRIAVVHGDDAARFHRAIASQCFDFVFTGHTHCREDRHEGRTRIINPGAVHRATTPGFAVLDLAADALEFVDL